jgi:hypothetical protein
MHIVQYGHKLHMHAASSHMSAAGRKQQAVSPHLCGANMEHIHKSMGGRGNDVVT